MNEHVVKRCSVCGRFRSYEASDEYCIGCGSDALESACACDREYDYALAESGPIHCPRCGRSFHGKSVDFDA
jgi:ribosomal protein L37E